MTKEELSLLQGGVDGRDDRALTVLGVGKMPIDARHRHGGQNSRELQVGVAGEPVWPHGRWRRLALPLSRCLRILMSGSGSLATPPRR